jgi:hypothetical protein
VPLASRSQWLKLTSNLDDHFTEVAAALEIAIGFWRFAQGKHAIDDGFDLMQGDAVHRVLRGMPSVDGKVADPLSLTFWYTQRISLISLVHSNGDSGASSPYGCS